MCGGARSFLILGILFVMKQICDLAYFTWDMEKIDILKKNSPILRYFEICYGFKYFNGRAQRSLFLQDISSCTDPTEL
jgi:hypothetical protein